LADTAATLFFCTVACPLALDNFMADCQECWIIGFQTIIVLLYTNFQNTIILHRYVPNQNRKYIYILLNLFPFKSIGLNAERTRQTQPSHTATNEGSMMLTDDEYHLTQVIKEEVREIMQLKLL
jgi:hypothetical protein